MECNINSSSISFDIDGRLNKSLKYVSGTNTKKYNTLVAMLNDANFIKYIKDNITNDDILKDYNDVKIDKLTVKDLPKLKQNKIKSLLNKYYNSTIRDITNYSTKKGLGRLMGFSSISAKNTAKNHVASMLVSAYFHELGKAKPKEAKDIIIDVNAKLKAQYYKMLTDFSHLIINNDDNNFSNSSIEEANNFINELNEANRFSNEIKRDNATIQTLNDNIGKAKSEIKKKQNNKEKVSDEELLKVVNNINKVKEIKNRIKSNIALLDTTNINVAAKALILSNKVAAEADMNTGTRISNFANLVRVATTDANNFYFQVFNTKQMTSVIKAFNKLDDIQTYIENEDSENDNLNINANDDTLDETAKSWEDNFYNNFNQTIDNKLRIELSTIPILDSKYNHTLGANQNYDTDNELGVTNYMDAQFVITQIYSFGDFTSVEDLIRSLDEKTQTIKKLYGLGLIVDKMKQSKEYANWIFTNFAKPIADKTIVSINNLSEDGIKIDVSNRATFPLTFSIYQLTNKLQSTWKTVYDIADTNNLKNLINIGYNDNTRQELKKIVQSYFPNITDDTFNNYFDNNTNSDKEKLFQTFIRNIGTIILNIQKYKEGLVAKESNYRAIYKNAIIDWNKGKNEYKDKWTEPRPRQRYLDYNDYKFTSSLTKSIIDFAKLITEFDESKANLNSTNAEGNSSANILKNCYITRFFEDLKGGTKEDSNAGLKKLQKYFTQGTENGKQNQYSNNPLLFGVKNNVDKVVVDGLFNPDGTINSNAKTVLDYSLFDGTKNNITSNGGGYAKLSKLDFFITGYVAFNQGTNKFTNDGQTMQAGNADSAVYFMRIGSDAPKIFQIRAPRLNDNSAKQAIYQHILDEYNIMIKGLNTIFENGILRTNTHGLLDRMLKDGDNIVKNGKLAGNAFKFKRLFETSSYNAEEALNALTSLYGEDNKALLTPTANGFTINTDHNGIIIYNTETNEFELNLSNDNIKSIKTIVNNWSNAAVQDGINYAKEFTDVMKEYNIPFNEGTFANYLLNDFSMNMSFDDIFEGDYKYYKNARDFLKRTKEAQAGGTGYSGYSINDENDNVIHELTWNNKPDKIRDVGAGEMIARNGFKGVTVYNTLKGSDVVAEMQKNLEDNFIAQGLNKELAHERSVEIAKGFGFDSEKGKGDITKINDAQSYITLEEFIRRRHADGTLGDYADLIKQLTDPNIAAEQINLKQINSRIQVQKNFYYDKIYDTDSGLYYPRQIKNAEFVLIPKLLPKDSELRKVYDWMKANDIGQLNTVETSKAGKKNIFTIWDKKTGKITDSFNSMFDNDGNFTSNNGVYDDSYSESYFYKYLYKQQDVPQHVGDTANKFGAQIQKKIIDNVINNNDSNHKYDNVRKLAEEYLNAFSTNIEEDFTSFLDAVGWKYDKENNRLINAEYATTDSDGNTLPKDQIELNKTTLRFDNFYNRAREEAARLGMDSNFIEYLIPTEFGKPRMPNWMNITANKLESIAQSIYNGRITRQTFPGWHAAQITDVGYSKKLKFDAKTGVMEVYLPRWSNMIPRGKTAEEDAAILKQIEKEGLDIQLAYRIPTEGKQSISTIKIVGFTNDALGSTIVVPEEWVTQTGSDFDVDSIYGMNWEMYSTKDKDGNITLHKIPFEENTIDNVKLYADYINKRIEDKVHKTAIGQEIQSKAKELRDSLRDAAYERNNAEYSEIDTARNEAFANLPIWAKNIIRNINANTAKITNSKGQRKIDIKSAYPVIKDKLAAELPRRGNDIEGVQEYIDYLTGILNIVNATDIGYTKEEYKSAKAKLISSLVDKANNDYITELENKAKEAGLISFKEFEKLPLLNRLNRKARNNFILDRMIKIMQDPTSREEQYGRSQFEDITNANALIDELSGATKKHQSPYSFVSQVDYMDDVMSGARMKALSVNFDTFLSKLNHIQPDFDSPVTVILDTADGYNIDAINKSYGKLDEYHNPSTGKEQKANTSTTADTSTFKKYIFKANKLGWSNDNRNIVGRLVTTYSAETTAHHLDAVKEGSIPNVTEYSFFVYKMLSGLGLDYEHVIGFIRQPAVTRIVRNNNLINSIFITDNKDPINMAIAQIAQNVISNGKINDDTYISTVLDNLKANSVFTEEFKDLFDIDISNMDNKDILHLTVPLQKSQMFNRITDERDNNTANVIKNAAYDLGMTLNFRNYQYSANKLSNLINATNPDKIGAANSLYKTRKIINDIKNLREDTTITKDGQNLMDVIYPETSEDNIDMTSSAYRPIATMFNLVTKNSYDTNSKLFTTENEDFYDAEHEIEKRLHRRFTEQQHKELKRYYITDLYNQNRKLLSALTLDKMGHVIVDTDKQNKRNTDQTNAYDMERSRIYGFGVLSDGWFEADNLDEPTNNDIERYKVLTPAQKVLFIQRAFPNNPGLFKYLNVNLYNPRDLRNKGINRQYISFNDNIYNVDDLIYEFEQTFNNHNPLVKLAAIDLIKYAFIAEGFNFKTSYISKLIPNDVLYDSAENGAMDIIDDMITAITETPTTIKSDEFINKFIRSHSEYTPIYTMKTSKSNRLTPTQILNACTSQDGSVYINAADDNQANQNLITKLRLFNNAGGFIRINRPGRGNKYKTILYKIYGGNPNYKDGESDTIESYDDYLLAPVNLLDSTETYEYSYNNNYNEWNNLSYYNSKAIQTFKNAVNKRNTVDNETEITKNILEQNRGQLSTPTQYVANAYNLSNPNLINELANSGNVELVGGINKLINDIVAGINTNRNKDIYTLNMNYLLGRIIPKGTKTTQEIKVGDDTYKVTIENYHLTPKAQSTLQTLRDAYRKQGDNAIIRDGNPIAFADVIREIENSNITTQSLQVFKVHLAIDDKTTRQQTVYNSTAPLADIDRDITDDTVQHTSQELPRRGIDDVSRAIMDDAAYDARKNESDAAAQFIRKMDKLHINRRMTASRAANREPIFVNAARYYQSASNKLINKLNKFNVAGVDYKMDDPAMYEALANSDTEFADAANVILQALTFGNNVREIMNLDLTSESKETMDAIESIRRSINNVINNSIAKSALHNMINIYFKKYSTNPEIRRDILKLRETFGDIDTIDLWFTDPASINNSEVQTVLKKIYGIFSKAEMFDVKENIAEYQEKLNAIKKKYPGVNIKDIVDKQGKLYQKYNNQFIEDRNNIIADASEAFANRYKGNNDDEKFTNFKKYIIKKYERDKFMYEHTYQPIKDDYYKRNLAIREEVMKIAGDAYYKYLQLSSMLYAEPTNDETDTEAKDRKVRIKTAMHRITSEALADGSEKTPEGIKKARAIKKFIEERRKLNEEYFETQEYDGFQDDYNRYNRIIKSYDAKHHELSLDEKLENTEYAEAYNWIKNNGRLDYTKESQEKIKEAFKALTRRSSLIDKKLMIGIKNIPGAMDENGNIDARVLNENQIALLKKEESNDFTYGYDNGDGEAILIKMIPDNLPMSNRINTKEMNLDDIDNKRKYELIQKINETLEKCIGTDGKIDYNYLMNNDIVSEEERNNLISNYQELHAINERKLNTIKAYYRKKGKEFKSNIAISNDYNIAMNIYNLNYRNRDKGQLYNILNIQTSDGRMVPNSLLFGYRQLEADEVDIVKTDAMKFIRDNLEFVPNEYYWNKFKEMRAKSDEEFDKWYKDNHIYNPYTHRYQPLKVWTTMEAKPNSELAKTITYIPSFDNMERNIKDGMENKDYDKFTTNYKEGDVKYDNSKKLTEGEKELANLITSTLNKYVTNNKGRKFIGKGYMPREKGTKVNLKWGIGQAFAMFGYSWHSNAESDKFHDNVDYAHDREIDIPMLNLIRGKGFKEFITYPQRANFASDEEYKKEYDRVKEENKKIAENNEKIDAENFSDDWENIMIDFIQKATIINSKQAAKPYMYLLLEDLANNQAYKLKGYWNRHLSRDYATSSNDEDRYKMEGLTRTYELIHNLARRVLYGEYHENNFPRTAANALQNITSAKYMIFNMYGGIANVTTGKTNIGMEEYANEYFGFKEFNAAEVQYLTNILTFIQDRFSDRAHSKTSAFIKEFHVVDYDQIVGLADSKDLNKKLEDIRSYLYSFQSIGEHFMQNSAMLAMLKSNRLFTDSDGIKRIGDFKDYSWDIERQAMRKTVQNNPDITNAYNAYLAKIKWDKVEQANLDMGRTDYNRQFLLYLKNSDNNNEWKRIANEYTKNRDAMLKDAKKEFLSDKNPTVESLYDYNESTGQLSIKPEILKEFEKYNKIGDIKELIAQFKNKIVAVNKKIHGVYDKDGAAYIESKWWGSALMQYHKHLWTGIMKRWRRRGYYSEFRQGRERGSYSTLMDFLAMDFTNNKYYDKETLTALGSVQTTASALLNTITNLKFNWSILSEAERANIRRNLGELTGILIACAVAGVLYALWDDDEINDNKLTASLLYLSDRLYSETSMYTPSGLVSELRTQWSNPIAGGSGINDALKITTIIPQYLFDPTFEKEYTNGVHAHQDKLAVLLRRNIPAIRPFDRIQYIDRDNDYYKIGASRVGLGIAQDFGNAIGEE